MGIKSIPHWWGQKVLPLVYENSLSYEEQIDKLIFKINEVIDTFNEYEKIIEELQGLVIDLSQMKVDIAELKVAVKGIDENREAIINLHTENRRLQDEIDRLTNLINSVVYSYNNIISYIDNAVASVKVENSTAWIRIENEFNRKFRELELIIQDLTDRLNKLDNTVFNRVAGVKLDQFTNNWAIYEDLRDLGMTNAERSEYGGTNSELASKVLNNRDYAINGKIRCKMHWLFSPASGRRTPHYNAISEALALVTDGLTNSAFAELDLTNEEVAELDLTNIEKFLYNPT